MSQADRYGRITYSASQLSAYFDRISLPESYRSSPILNDKSLINSPQGLDLLAALQKYNLAAIPFESLALHYSSHHTISIDPAALFHKIVERGNGRGGYCMENSCLFGTVLRSLGYDVYPTGARVNEAVQPMSASKNWKGPKFDGWNHMINIVTIQGKKYFVDVGFGSSGPHHPIPLDSTYSTKMITQPTRLVKEAVPDLLTSTASATSSADQAIWIYQYRHDEASDWLSAYCFGETEFTPADFVVMNHFTSTSPTSWFTFTVLCVKMAMEEGELVGDMTMVGGEVKKRIGGKSEVMVNCENEEQRIEALEKYFGIRFNAEEVNGIRGMPTELM